MKLAFRLQPAALRDKMESSQPGRSGAETMLRVLTLLAFVCLSLEPARCADVPEKPLSALIVFDHEGKTTAIRVDGERQLAVLENYFPSYRTRPESDEAGAWDARYEVYFNFKHGQTLRVLVSANSRYWSMGRGDFELRGYFADYVTALLKGSSRRLPER
jgi:hypothetical protein